MARIQVFLELQGDVVIGSKRKAEAFQNHLTGHFT